MYLFLLIVLLLFIIIYIFLQQPQFGKAPSGERLQRIKQSPHFRNGRFENLRPTPALAEEATIGGILKEMLFSKKKRLYPADRIPSVKTNLLQLDPARDILIWFGHSSYFMQVDGKRILVDPVLSGSASPLPFSIKAFKGTDIYSAADIPDIDYLIITHDHWDHLDYATVKKLQPRVGKVICPLGAGSHLEYWGYTANQLIEKDWNETIVLDKGFTVTTVPARHFAGRLFKRNNTLWTSYVLQTPTLKIFIGGDSGYDLHFKEIGERFGPFDMAIMENGQYDKNWRYIHMLPSEFLQAAKELQAKRIIPVHSSKFKLGNHDWDEPLSLIMEYNQSEGLSILTPMIGELVNLKDEHQFFSNWWKSVN
jgi:L-ascorbate metabolism protein UlaG (beta-lactamase superfamily)